MNQYISNKVKLFTLILFALIIFFFIKHLFSKNGSELLEFFLALLVLLFCSTAYLLFEISDLIKSNDTSAKRFSIIATLSMLAIILWILYGATKVF